MVSYNDKHNQANGEDNRDGSSNNCSDNNGVEGPTNDPRILDLRARQQRNMFATVLFSQGTPMILAGDELSRTQRGNNNAYCQDNEISWLDWQNSDDRKSHLHGFVRRLIALRRAHPMLRWPRYLHGRNESPVGVRDLGWFTPHGKEMADAQWQDYFARCMGMLLAGDADSYLLPSGDAVSDSMLLLILNSHNDRVPFTLPRVAGSEQWSCLIDTAAPDRPEGELKAGQGEVVAIEGRSVILFALDRTV